MGQSWDLGETVPQNLGAVWREQESQRVEGRGFPKGEGSAGPQCISCCKPKSVSTYSWCTAKCTLSARPTVRAAFGIFFAGKGTETARPLKEVLASLQAALNFPQTHISNVKYKIFSGRFSTFFFFCKWDGNCKFTVPFAIKTRAKENLQMSRSVCVSFLLQMGL